MTKLLLLETFFVCSKIVSIGNLTLRKLRKPMIRSRRVMFSILHHNHHQNNKIKDVQFQFGIQNSIKDEDGFHNPLPYKVSNISTIHSNLRLTKSQEQISEND